MAGISFKELIVWQKAKQVALCTYRSTERMPSKESFGLMSQMRRASISISSNIAEGHLRRSVKDKARFLRIAWGSGAELESQIEIAKDLYPHCDFTETSEALTETMRILNSMIQKYADSK